MQKLMLQLYSLLVAGGMIACIAVGIEPSTRLEITLTIIIGLVAFRPMVRICYRHHRDM